jgi:hypothetical protein
VFRLVRENGLYVDVGNGLVAPLVEWDFQRKGVETKGGRVKPQGVNLDVEGGKMESIEMLVENVHSIPVWLVPITFLLLIPFRLCLLLHR